MKLDAGSLRPPLSICRASRHYSSECRPHCRTGSQHARDGSSRRGCQSCSNSRMRSEGAAHKADTGALVDTRSTRLALASAVFTLLLMREGESSIHLLATTLAHTHTQRAPTSVAALTLPHCCSGHEECPAKEGRGGHAHARPDKGEPTPTSSVETWSLGRGGAGGGDGGGQQQSSKQPPQLSTCSHTCASTQPNCSTVA